MACEPGSSRFALSDFDCIPSKSLQQVQVSLFPVQLQIENNPKLGKTRRQFSHKQAQKTDIPETAPLFIYYYYYFFLSHTGPLLI